MDDDVLGGGVGVRGGKCGVFMVKNVPVSYELSKLRMTIASQELD